MANILTVTMLSILSYFIFGVICINYFKGLFNDCETSKVQGSVQNKWDCINLGGEWKDAFLNFNNIWDAMQTLFIFSTNVQWEKIMYQAGRARG